MPRPGTTTLCLALLVLTVTAYLPVWHNDFVDLDDEIYITDNPSVIGGMSGRNFVWAWTTTRGGYWQPLTWLSLQLDAHCFSQIEDDGKVVLSPAAFHGQNLLWHAANVVLLFTLLQRLTGARWRSFLVAALFAVHPMHVESVAWAVERKDVLSSFFGLLTVWAYVRYLERPGRKRYAVVLLAYLAALLAKPMLLTLPFVLLLLDYWPLGRVGAGAGGPSLRRLVLEKVPLLVLAAAIGVATLASRTRYGSVVSLSSIPPSARLANAATAYGWYVGSTFWPTNLAALYPHPRRDWAVGPVLAGGAVLLCLTALALWQARRRPWLTCGWLWFAGTLVPVLGLAQGGEQAWADRFSYWPHIGLFVAVVWGLAELAARFRVPVAASATAAVVVLTALAGVTWRQVGYWKDTPTLWERVLAVAPDNYRPHVNLGKYLVEHGRPDEAIPHFARAVQLRPDIPDFHYAYGVALLGLGEFEAAAGQLQEALDLDSLPPETWHNLGMAYWNLGRTRETVRCFREEVERDPGSADARAWLGRALWRKGEREQAVRYFQEALRIAPREGWAWHGLGTVYLTEGRPEKAAAAFRRAMQANPRNYLAGSDLGLALGRQGGWVAAADSHSRALKVQDESDRQLERMHHRPPAPDGVRLAVVFRCRLAYTLSQLGDPRAADVYRQALRIDPDWPAKFTARARRLATDPDPNLRDPWLAVELIRQAIEAVGARDSRMQEVLAAAEAALQDSGIRPLTPDS